MHVWTCACVSKCFTQQISIDKLKLRVNQETNERNLEGIPDGVEEFSVWLSVTWMLLSLCVCESGMSRSG